MLRLCLRHRHRIEGESDRRYRCQCQEAHGIAGADDDRARQRRAERRAQPLRRRDRALRDVEAARTLSQVGNHHREQCAEDTGPYPVERLHADQPPGIVRQRIQRAARGQHAERDEEQRLSPPAIDVAADDDGDRHHHQLCGDDTGGGQRGRRILAHRLGEQLADGGQHRRIGEVEQERDGGEQQQRPVLDQHAPAAGLVASLVRFAIEAACHRIVDIAVADAQRCGNACHCQRAHQPEDDDRPELPRQCSGQRGGYGVAGMIERLVPPDALRKQLGAEQAQRDRADRRGEHCPRHRRERLGRSNYRETVDEGQRHAGQRHQQCRDDDDRRLVAAAVDQAACGRLRYQPDDARDGQHHADGRLVPAMRRPAHREQIDGKIRAQPIAHIRQEKVQRIQRAPGAMRSAAISGCVPWGRGSQCRHAVVLTAMVGAAAAPFQSVAAQRQAPGFDPASD
ncbi:hypothetical protein WR25_08146 [Diploscapter pachys]|uniref:Uncharacterized protein n=1 Tax=Diploscapter pachys TaxID=2018661 RepID=A0A2A2M2H3_9BILA|nr:hypothetical protein WR25_08146 [Diploscapter pachys]